MPRARTTESEDLVVVKKPRAPRARAASLEGETAVAPRKRAPRKTAAKKVAPMSESVPEPEPTPTAQRKAPTPIAAERRIKARTTKAFIAVIFFCILLSAAGVVVGMFDHGAIDVIAVVNSRNEQISRGEVRDANGQTVTQTVPVQADSSGLHVADSSLSPAPVAAAQSTATPPVEVVGTSTATSTATTSSASTTRDPALKPAL